ncbi:GNAT family N-acetyltransferase [Blastococcus brunescens]|uniref:GNAT family N-acetyltransferase n=1 Tax=Blastococcus brunescens TaxID=1564165 RepID=A0ABZ1B9Y8_9ACTN|nr:GNAT family N-acetyltransferase [Blastococcus sp. BMG 8361]WRL66289.1 GNAT family N-acetyltransferase [Blastococcus sp. BMG 8361]
MRQLVREDPSPGVLAYDGDEVVGWAAIHPRAGTSFARNRRIPVLDDLDVWSLWCVRVRPGHRGTGISHALVGGAVEFARDRGAPVVEAYPVDNRGAKVDLTMAYVGTRALFERAGFTKAADTDSVLNGFPACSCASISGEPGRRAGAPAPPARTEVRGAAAGFAVDRAFRGHTVNPRSSGAQDARTSPGSSDGQPVAALDDRLDDGGTQRGAQAGDGHLHRVPVPAAGQ